MRFKSGTYTTDLSYLYFTVKVLTQNEQELKAVVTLKYKHGIYKGDILETKKYVIQNKNITHWRKYET